VKNGGPLLFYGDSYRYPDIYHTIRFLAPDPQIVLEHDREIVMLTNSLEQGRAEKQSRVTAWRTSSEKSKCIWLHLRTAHGCDLEPTRCHCRQQGELN